VGHEYFKGLVAVINNFVAHRNTNNVLPAIGTDDIKELVPLTWVSRIIAVDPDSDNDLEVEIETLDRVHGEAEDATVCAVEAHTLGGLDKQLELLVDRGLSVEAVGQLGVHGHVSHAVEDALQRVVDVENDGAIGTHDYVKMM